MIQAGIDALGKGFVNNIVALGTDVVWSRPADASFNVVTVKAGFHALGATDDMIANAYGIEARVVTVAVELLTFTPLKFDQLGIGGMFFTVQAIKDVWLQNALLGYKCYVRGK